MDTTIPAELLELKARFDEWRATRKYIREPIPAELRQAAVEMSQRYPPAVVNRVLKLDPWRLNGRAKQSELKPTRKKPQTAFFKLPTGAALPAPQSANDCRLQLERPDGARLTLTLPALDLVSINRLCADFLRA